MGYESYEPYEPYDPYGQRQQPPQEPYQQPQQGQYQEPYPEQYREQQHPEQPYPEQQQYSEQQPYSEQPYPEQQQYQQQQPYQDAQWAQSGLGWERQAWDETRLGVSPLQELQYPPQQEQREQQQEQGYGYPQPEEYREEQYSGQPYEQPYEQQYEQQYEQYEEFEQYGQSEQYQPEYQPEPGLPRDLPVPDYPPSAAESAEVPGQRAQRPQSQAESAPSAAPLAGNGRGAFGAAGIAVLAAISALAASGALLVVIALVQAGIGYGWQQATTVRENGRPDRRAVLLTVLIGWAAAASAFRLPAGNDLIGLPVTLGVGFLLLAADQTLRGGPLGRGDRVAGLGTAVTGGLFAVLPAGFVVAERADDALTAACALAAAMGVLCCALLGRNPVRGILAALVLGAGIGAVAAQSLTAHGGLRAGALGGALAALGAAAAVGALDRISAEGEARGSTRIVSQVLPLALAALGALFAAAVYR
ncbi:MAG TPA: hypothetical protein VH372_06980 [Actinospica sp.]|nr:hypothetical protein [Actinospica sp.]